MADPQPETQGTVHTYLSTAAHKDWAVVFLIGSFIFEVLQDHSFIEAFVPHQYHDLIAKAMLLTALFIRFYNTKRPVAIFEGTPVEVKSLPPQTPTAVDLGKVGKLLIVLALLGGLAGLPACAKAPPNLTPAAVAAFHGTQIIHDLDRVRDAADAAHKTVPPLLSAQTTLQVVTWHQTAITIVHEAKDGWRAAVRQSLDELTARLSPTDRQVIGPYVAIVKSLLSEVSQ